MATNMATKREKSQLLKIFQSLDKNGDGQITKEELKSGFDKSLGVSDAEISDLMKMVDNDSSGTIDYKGTFTLSLNLNRICNCCCG